MPRKTDLSRRRILQAGAAALTARYVSLAHAADPLRIGLILPMSGPFASTGKQIEAACRLYMQRNGDSVAGPHTRVVVTGGWARDQAVLEAKGRLGAVESPAVVEAGCRGAALLAGVAARLYPGVDQLPAVPHAAKEPA